MKNLAVLGSGDLGQLIAYHAEDSGYKIVGFFDDYIRKGELINSIPILGNSGEIESSFRSNKFDSLIIGIGYKHFAHRRMFFEKFHKRIPFATIIHSSCYVSPSCHIMEGTVILPGCTLDRNVTVEENVLINTGCVIAHDSKVQNHTFLSPSVAIAGFVTIGSCCNIGINTSVIDNIKICNNVQTGGGSVVIKDIVLPGLYVGNPVRFVR